MKFSGKVGNGPVNKRLNVAGRNPDQDPYRDTGKTCLGGGMHCPSASSYLAEQQQRAQVSDSHQSHACKINYNKYIRQTMKTRLNNCIIGR